jgi:O-glycosyl hydrolase
MSKQTAIEYLIQEIKNDLFVHSKSAKEWNEVFRKAIQMEREQIIGAANNGCKGMCMIDTSRDGKNYYNETYGGNNE